MSLSEVKFYFTKAAVVFLVIKQCEASNDKILPNHTSLQCSHFLSLPTLVVRNLGFSLFLHWHDESSGAEK